MATTDGTTTGAAPARIAHEIAGRLRLRLLGDDWDSARFDALERALAALRDRPGILGAELKRAAKAVVLRYDLGTLDRATALDLAGDAGLAIQAPDTDEGGGRAEPRLSASTEELAALLGVPTSFDRRLLEGLALSGVSLVAARTVAPLLGGGATIPAYFAIWYLLRRATGLGTRR